MGFTRFLLAAVVLGVTESFELRPSTAAALEMYLDQKHWTDWSFLV